MKSFLLFALILLANYGYSQKFNDENAFIAGDYDRKILAENKVMAVDVSSFIGERKMGKRYIEFDQNGQLAMMIYSNAQDEMLAIHQFVFDSLHDLRQRFSLNLATEKNDTVSYFRVYKGNLLMSDSSNEVGLISKYVYDEKGRMAKKIIDFNSGSIGRMIREFHYSYDGEGRVAEVKLYFIGGINNMNPELTSQKVLVYNEKGWLMSENEKVIKDETGSIVYAYDEMGRCIQVAKEKAETKNYTYDSKGLLLKKTTQMKDSDMEFTMTHAFSYRFYEQEE